MSTVERPETDGAGWRALPLSANSPASLDHVSGQLAEALEASGERAWTQAGGVLRPGEPAGAHRRVIIARSAAQAAAIIRDPDPALSITGSADGEPTSTVFMFPGVGDHHEGMAEDLYRQVLSFRAGLDGASAVLRPLLGSDITAALYAAQPDTAGGAPADSFTKLLGHADASGPLHQTRVSQPLVFAVELCLGQLLISWGLRPSAVVGYSVGEYVAACLAGVMPPDQALNVVARRAELIEHAPPGAMLAIPLPPADVAALLPSQTYLAAINGPAQCVVSGAPEAVAKLAEALTRRGEAALVVPTRHAFHSPMMGPVEEPLRQMLGSVTLRPPTCPVLSNVSGSYLSAGEATSRDYWARHLRHPVRFSDNMAEMWRLPRVLAVELGAGQMLRSMANQHPARRTAGEAVVLPSLRTRSGSFGAVPALLGVAAAAWVRGDPVDWDAIRDDIRCPAPAG
jgi:acyl transferase domain-containing protein